MRCIPLLTKGTDRPYWIRRDAFLGYFDPEDFFCRDVKDVVSSYLADWFYTGEGGQLGFYLPTVQFSGAKTQFINGGTGSRCSCRTSTNFQ